MSIEARGQKLSKDYHDNEISSKISTIVNKLGKRGFFSLFKDRYKDSFIEIHDKTHIDTWEFKILWKGKLVCKDSGACTTLSNMFDGRGQPDLYIDVESGWIEYINNLYDPIVKSWKKEKDEKTKKRFNL